MQIPNIDPNRQKLDRLTQAFHNLTPLVAEKISDDDQATHLLDHNVGMEKPYLLAQIGMWLLRGASIEDIERHAANPDGHLPFDGAESGMYAAVISAMTVRAGQLADAADMVVSIARLLDDVLTSIQETSELTRGDICDVIYQRDCDDAQHQRETN